MLNGTPEELENYRKLSETCHDHRIELSSSNAMEQHNVLIQLSSEDLKYIINRIQFKIANRDKDYKEDSRDTTNKKTVALKKSI